MTNKKIIEKLEREKQKTIKFWREIDQLEIIKFLRSIDFNKLKNIHVEILIVLLEEGVLNIYQIKKHLLNKNITSSYSYTYESIKELEDNSYLITTKIGRERRVRLLDSNIYSLFQRGA